ncbi:transposase [Necator americanus]|uniref:Transposase n=1 Tax=Necator americanus TaxID=51031 RepID=W2T712_NECAM|nr:transposase [Necator americanus]ETN77424.1 transposase [Necator americanus]
MRSSSRTLDQFLILLSCMIINHHMDLEDAEHAYDQMSMKKKYVCQRHYIQAAKYMCVEVERNTGMSITPGCTKVPIETWKVISKSIKDYCELVDKSVPIFEENIGRFYSDCVTKYYVSGGWKTDLEEQIRAPKPQESNNEDVKPLVASVSALIPTKEGRLNDSVDQKPNLEKSICTPKPSTTPTTSFGATVVKTGHDVKGISYITRDEKVTDPTDDIDASRCTEYSTGTEVMERTSECSTVPSPSYGYAPASRAVEPQTSEDEFSKLTCSLCGVIGLAMDFRPAATEPQYNIVLLSLLLMQSSMDNARAIAWYNQAQRRQLMICRSHYIKAAARLSMEIKREWGKFPENGLAEVPENIIYSMLTVIRLYRDFIDEIEDYDEKEGMDNYGFRELWEKLGNSSNVIPDSSNFDDCLPLFRTEEDIKPVVFDEVSAIDLIEGDGFHSTLTSRNLADHFVEDSPLIRNDEKSWIDTLMQDDDNERNSIQSDQKDHIVLFDSSSLPSTSTAPEPHLDPNLQIKMEIEEDDIAMENTAEDDISMQDLDEDKIMKFLSDRSKSIGELTRELNITSNAVLSYLRCTDAEREMCKWVPSDGILQCRLEICTSLVLRNIRDSILDRIVTYGEKWIYFNNRERPTLWLDDTVKDIEVQSESNPEREKVLLTVWWSSAGIIHHHLVGGGKSMTEDDFIKQISEVYRKLGSKQPAKGPLLLCDNPRPYVSRNSIQKLYLYGIEVLPHPPQSPDLLPSKYHIFRHLNHYLAGRNFYDDVEVEKAFLSFIAFKKPKFYSEGISELISRWKKCITLNGDYFHMSS